MLGKLRDALTFALARTSATANSYAFTSPAEPPSPIVAETWQDSDPPRPRRAWKKHLIIFLIIVGVVAFIAIEMRTSLLQARFATDVLRGASYKVEAGNVAQTFHTGHGPYDERMGYTRLNDMIARLDEYGYKVQAQARWSERLNQIGNFGLFPIYKEKAQGGLRVLDRDGTPLHETMFPQQAFGEFPTIPPLMVKSLLFIENREILDGWAVRRNPAIEWDRLAKAVVDFGQKQINHSHQISGGSTLATQLEKVRHSPSGRTDSPKEKIRQITSASLRAYMEGSNTLDSRKRIVRDYLNSVPLAATAAFGEVIGVADGLKAWYNTDPQEAVRLLMIPESAVSYDDQPKRAAMYRQVLSLLLAINRPTYFLRSHPEALKERTDAYLRVLANDGIISNRLRDQALESDIRVMPADAFAQRPMDLQRKNTDAVRYSLLNLLNVESLYELDRIDMTVETSLHGPASTFAAKTMGQLNDPAFLYSAGLVGKNLLSPGQGTQVVYTLTMFERGTKSNRLLLQLDNAKQALNLNEGSKLELGSTAKLRTLATYLDIIAEIRERLVDKNGLDKISLENSDKLTKWMVEYLQKGGKPELKPVLNAAMERVYSASPGEAFYTGGGLHSFANFNSSDNGRMLTVREAFYNSINLVFIRIMRDIVDYNVRRTKDYSPTLFTDETNPNRERLLARFADREGSQFMRTFYDRYNDQSPEDALETLLSQRTMSPTRFAVMYRSVRPNASFGEFQLQMLSHVEDSIPEKRLQDLYEQFAPGKMDWNDRGYVAGVHPLELWLVNYLYTNPEANWQLVKDASGMVRQEVYRWLFKSRHKLAKDLRIRSVLEADAFALIHPYWKKQGFPFQRLVPSLATAIGSSGDTPSALADLAGIIINDGVHIPNTRVERLRFAEGTPFETRVVHEKESPVRVFAPEIADQLHRAMLGVVEFGTARRAFKSVSAEDGENLPVAGKTGTGDNRNKSIFAVGRTRSRTAAFVFTIGERYFGTVVAYVPGEEAGGYSFSSALPVSVFKLIVPGVVKVLEGGEPPPPIQVRPIPVAPVAPVEQLTHVTDEGAAPQPVREELPADPVKPSQPV